MNVTVSRTTECDNSLNDIIPKGLGNWPHGLGNEHNRLGNWPHGLGNGSDVLGNGPLGVDNYSHGLCIFNQLFLIVLLS